jgi:hypothetical protein
MPALTPDRLLQRAIPLAAQDRESLADAYGTKSPEAAEVLEQRERILSLKGKKLKDLTSAESAAAMQAFIFAEQWEESLADSNPGKAVERRARTNLAYFRALRRHLWGRTKLEAVMEDSTSIQIWPPSKESIALGMHGGAAPNKKT